MSGNVLRLKFHWFCPVERRRNDSRSTGWFVIRINWPNFGLAKIKTTGGRADASGVDESWLEGWDRGNWFAYFRDFCRFWLTPVEWLCFQLLQVERLCFGTTYLTRIDSSWRALQLCFWAQDDPEKYLNVNSLESVFHQSNWLHRQLKII